VRALGGKDPIGEDGQDEQPERHRWHGRSGRPRSAMNGGTGALVRCWS
jgi:hypothetical protein